MRIFFDTEFIDDGKTIDLISIGAVREDGREFYAESIECDLDRASEWVKKNVLPHLTDMSVPRSKIATDILAFAGDKPEFWGFYAAYDWVALCQLYGPMIAIPKGWPWFVRDLRQLCEEAGNPKLPPPKGTQHNALDDARHIRDAHAYVCHLPIWERMNVGVAS